MNAEFELKPGVVIAVRYRIEAELQVGAEHASPARPAFVGIDETTDEPVVLFRVTPGEARALRPVIGLRHAHLARLLAISELPDGNLVLVVEQVCGTTLDPVLDEVGHESTVEAVRSALRLADAVTAIHQVGGLHGFLHPGSLWAAPEGRKPPILSWAPFPSSPVPSPFLPPALPGEERPIAEGLDGDTGGSEGPSGATDAWGVGALFHHMLLGHPPPASGLMSEDELRAAGVADPELCATLYQALAADPKVRGVDATVLKRVLARWFVDHSSDEISAVSSRGSTPPPLPSSSIPPSLREGRPSAAPSHKAAPKPRISRGWVAGLAVGAFAIALALTWGLSEVWPDRVAVVEIPSAGAPLALPSPSFSNPPPHIDLSEVAVSSDAGIVDDTAQCVVGFLPQGTLGAHLPPFSWLCGQADPREGSARLKAGIAASPAGKGVPSAGASDAAKAFVELGWYEMAVYGIIYRACCPEAPPLSLPPPSAGCARLDELLEQMARQVVAEQPANESLGKLAEAVDCESKLNRAALYKQKGPAEAGERAAFTSLIHRIEGHGK